MDKLRAAANTFLDCLWASDIASDIVSEKKFIRLGSPLVKTNSINHIPYTLQPIIQLPKYLPHIDVISNLKKLNPNLIASFDADCILIDGKKWW